MDIFRKLFGLNRDDEQESQQRRMFERHFNDSEQQDGFFERNRFEVFTDPLQMHQYFEQQMSEMLKTFGFQEFGQFPTFGSTDIPSMENNGIDNEQNSRHLRDQFLKHGYVKPGSIYEKMDKDLDEKVMLGNLDSLLSDNHENQVTPYSPSKPKTYSHGTTQSIRTIAKPDGVVETQHTKRDTQGNEETTVCHKIGNKEYCVIKKKDKDGNEETIEQFFNMTEDEKNIFSKIGNNDPEIKEQNTSFGFPWDKLFK